MIVHMSKNFNSENVIDADYQMKITKLITNLRLLAGAASA